MNEVEESISTDQEPRDDFVDILQYTLFTIVKLTGAAAAITLAMGCLVSLIN